MSRAATLATMLAFASLLAVVGVCILVADWLARRLLVWLIVLLVTLNSGCTFALVPGNRPHVRFCVAEDAWKCHPSYDWSDMDYSPDSFERVDQWSSL